MLTKTGHTRREFLEHALGASLVVGWGATVPGILTRAAWTAETSATENVLVVVQLSGGNDGLNTVVPFADPEYQLRRPQLAIPANQVLKVDDSIGLHPSLRGLADVLDDGKLAVIQGVGYPEPNRSHFESMDIWHTCHRKGAPRDEGWLGRFLDQGSGITSADAPALHLGHEKQPLALASRTVRSPSIASLDRFRLDVAGDKELPEMIRELTGTVRASDDDLLGFLQSSTTSALAASARVEQARRDYTTPVSYPDNALSEKLRTVAQLIDAGLKTKVYYVTLDGFDTHSQQPAAHAALLSQLGSAVAAFIQDVAHQGHDQRVLLMSFSEFGRRVQENASQGTDHGAAGPMLLAGERVRAGLVGSHPSLTELQDGDLKHHTDFRQVYATVLEDWFQCSSEAVLGDRFERLSLLNAAAQG